jgi:predicted nucleic acid-binding Zn ribbon protein
MQTEPKPLASALKDAAKYFKLSENIQKGDVLLLFEKIVGPNISKFAKAKTFLKGTLILEVESSAWKNELFILREEIKGKINQFFKKEVVKQIRII